MRWACVSSASNPTAVHPSTPGWTLWKRNCNSASHPANTGVHHQGLRQHADAFHHAAVRLIRDTLHEKRESLAAGIGHSLGAGHCGGWVSRRGPLARSRGHSFSWRRNLRVQWRHAAPRRGRRKGLCPGLCPRSMAEPARQPPRTIWQSLGYTLSAKRTTTAKYWCTQVSPKQRFMFFRIKS